MAATVPPDGVVACLLVAGNSVIKSINTCQNREPALICLQWSGDCFPTHMRMKRRYCLTKKRLLCWALTILASNSSSTNQHQTTGRISWTVTRNWHLACHLTTFVDGCWKRQETPLCPNMTQSAPNLIHPSPGQQCGKWWQCWHCGRETSGTSHLATPCNAGTGAGTVAKLSLWTTLGSPALILVTTFLPVAARTNGSSSDSIKVSSRSRESRTSSPESRTRRPGGPGLDASPKQTPLRPYKEFLTLPSVCVASMHLLFASA